MNLKEERRRLEAALLVSRENLARVKNTFFQAQKLLGDMLESHDDLQREYEKIVEKEK